MATVTFSKSSDVTNQPQAFGQLKAVLGTATFAGSTTDEGDAFTASLFGLNKVVAVIPAGPAVSSDGEAALLVSWNTSTLKFTTYESTNAANPFPEKAGESIADYTQVVLALGY
jgi:hypothetical protein